jgi:serine protease Do
MNRSENAESKEEPIMSRQYARSVLTISFVALATMAAVTAVTLAPAKLTPLSHAAEPGQSAVARQQLAVINDLSDAFQHVAETLRPSVVSISSTTVVEVPDREIPDELRRFFGDEGFWDRFEAPEGGLRQRGLGSGLIVSSDGYIVTNNHVVRGADEVTVILGDDRDFRANLVGADPKTDLALLKIEATGLTPASWGDSESTRVGEWVLAIGSPFGLDQTVTAGIISAKGRARVGLADYEDFLQTDAAINPGNSGGPLVNMKGEVVGINTAIASRTGGSMGVGFAIPSKMARSVMDALRTKGRVVRGYLGALIQDLDEDLAESFGFSGTDGVLVGDVVADGPAVAAGLQPGDIITRLGSQAVKSANELRNAVAAIAPGTGIELSIFRDGRTETISVKIGELPSDPSVAMEREESSVQLGMTVRPLTPELSAQLEFDGTDGVVVTKVEAGSAADRGGIRPGDIIVAIGNVAIRGLSDYRGKMREADLSRGVLLQVVRDGGKRFVALRDE